MRKAAFILTIASTALLTSCMLENGVSEGKKYGTLQKLSTKHWPCEYHVAEFAFEGGKAVELDDKTASFGNTQVIEVDQAAFDTLDSYMGDKVIFEYKDKGYEGCGEAKILTSIKRK